MAPGVSTFPGLFQAGVRDVIPVRQHLAPLKQSSVLSRSFAVAYLCTTGKRDLPVVQICGPRSPPPCPAMLAHHRTGCFFLFARPSAHSQGGPVGVAAATQKAYPFVVTVNRCLVLKGQPCTEPRRRRENRLGTAVSCATHQGSRLSGPDRMRRITLPE